MDSKKTIKDQISNNTVKRHTLITKNLDILVDIINQGGVIAYPTESVWGLGCNPWNKKAVNKILSLKKRNSEKGFILVGSHISQFSPLVNILPTAQKETLEDSWPGPHTWVIPDEMQWAPVWVRGRFNTVAVRVSRHPEIVSLCNALMQPIISTSANTTGKDALVDQNSVETSFSNTIDAIFSGTIGKHKKPTTIQDLFTGHTIRA